MYLFKCSCGCHSTLQDTYFDEPHIYTCQNCGRTLDFTRHVRMSDLGSFLAKHGFSFHSFPDNAEINFQFNIND